MDPPNLDSETLARAMDDFFQAMALRTDRNVRVGKRVTAMLRIGMVSFALFAALMTAMIWAFTDRVRVMTDVLGTMQTQFTEMADNMTTMRSTIDGLERDMRSFSVITAEMQTMRSTVSGMKSDMNIMSDRVSVMNSEVALITGNTAQMNQSFRVLSPSVARIGAAVAHGSGPMKTFNNLFPFPWMLK